jgi:hypothetical protein
MMFFVLTNRHACRRIPIKSRDWSPHRRTKLSATVFGRQFFCKRSSSSSTHSLMGWAQGLLDSVSRAGLPFGSVYSRKRLLQGTHLWPALGAGPAAIQVTCQLLSFPLHSGHFMIFSPFYLFDVKEPSTSKTL